MKVIKLQFSLILLFYISTLTVCKKDIYIAGLFPLLSILNSSVALTELAVREINANPNVLPDHNLVIRWGDTNCDTHIAFKSFTEFMHQDNVTYASIFGLPCLASASAIADIISVYNTMMITFSAYIPDFYSLYYSSQQTYVVNGFPTGLNAISAQLKFITDHQWKRIAIVNFESEYFTHLGYELQKALYKLDIENTAETISVPLSDAEYLNQLDNVIDAILAEKYRVIVFNTYHWTVADFFCRVVNRTLNFEEFSFLLPGSYLYQVSFDYYWINGTCSLSAMLELVSGSIGFTQYPRIIDFINFNHTTISGLTPHEIIEDYGLHNFTLVPEVWNTFGLYMYDSMWALALGLNQSINQGFEPANLTDEVRANFSKSLFENILGLRFDGLAGEVSFVQTLRVSDQAQLIEFTKDGYEFRGLYINLPHELSNLENLSAVELINASEFKYWNSKLSDGVENHFSNPLIFSFITLSSILVTIYIVVFIAIILVGVYKRYAPATHSEPAMSIFILVSNLFLLAFAVLLNVDGKFFTFSCEHRVCSIYCHLLVWLGFVTTSLILGGVLAKALKLYALWVLNKFKRNDRQKLRFRYLVLIPLTLAFIDTLVVLLWFGINPIVYKASDVPSDVINPPIYRISFCQFEWTPSLAVLIAIKVGLVIICLILAYHLRNVTHKSQRYSFIIGLIMYSTLFFAILIVFILGFVSNYETKIALASLFAILASILTVTIIGVPIVYYLIKDPTGKNLFEFNNVENFPEDNNMLKLRISALERDLERANSVQEVDQVGASPKKYSFLNENQCEVLWEKIGEDF